MWRLYFNMKQFECKSINDILETRKVDRTAKYKLKKAKIEEIDSSYFDINIPFYFIEKI